MKKLFLVLCVIFTVLALFAAPKQKNNGSQKAKSSKVQNQTGNLQWSNKSQNTMGWYSAVKYCKELNEGGHNDWRLPDIDELRTLIKQCPKTETGGECKVNAESCCLSTACWQENSCQCDRKDYFKSSYNKLDSSAETLWSSSNQFLNTNYAWVVDFSKAGLNTFKKDRFELPVRCARSKNNSSKNDNGDPSDRCEREYKSQMANLQWSKVAPKVLDLNDAINYCKNLTEAGHSDWKLPNIDELRSLIINNEYTEIGGKCKISEIAGQLSSDLDCRATDGDNSKLGDTGNFLSSSTVTNTSGVWYIKFRGGGIYYDAPINGVYEGFNVRCVRQQ